MQTCYERGMPTCDECGKFVIHLNANGKCPDCNGCPDNIVDYRIWSQLELIARIEELEGLIDTAMDGSIPVHTDLLEVCAHCGEPMNAIVRVPHHTENGVDVTK